MLNAHDDMNHLEDWNWDLFIFLLGGYESIINS